MSSERRTMRFAREQIRQMSLSKRYHRNVLWESSSSLCTESLRSVDIDRICSICLSHLENNGICLHQRSSEEYKCLCTYGYSGWNCSENLNQSFCSSHQCLNNGTCLESPMSPHGICRCQQGFAGRFCEENVRCGDQQCQYPEQVCLAESCVNVTGELYCLLHQCQHGGICDPTTRKCQCQRGFAGLNCELKSLFCQENETICLNNGTCLWAHDRCSCSKNFTGKFCEIHLSTDELHR